MPRPSRRRTPLSRDLVVRGAIRLADRHGAQAITMRRVAEELGVEAMSLYHHVPSKESLLDAVVDAVFAEIRLPDAACDWREWTARRARSAREVLSRHRWALGLLDSRPVPGPATLRHHDAALGTFREAGFPLDLAVHAVSLVDSYVGGFVLQEVALPVTTEEEVAALTQRWLADLDTAGLPHLTAVVAERASRPRHDPDEEFDFGLEVVLDGLERRRAGRRQA